MLSIRQDQDVRHAYPNRNFGTVRMRVVLVGQDIKSQIPRRACRIDVRKDLKEPHNASDVKIKSIVYQIKTIVQIVFLDFT